MALYLDTETTGLHASGGDAIVEIAIVDERGVALINTLVNPNRTIPWHASNVHGISDSMVRGMPDLNDLLPQIRKVISGQQLVIYNAPFDVSFFPNRLREASSIECAMRNFASALGGKSRKLDVAAAHVGHVWTGEAHRALADTLACKSVWNWLEGKKSKLKGHSSKSTVLQHEIITCRFCLKKLRIPSGKKLEVTCPLCHGSFLYPS